MRATDVLITVHGAGETLIGFLRPCAVVFEIFPWGFEKDYFGELAVSAGVQKHRWVESREHTVSAAWDAGHPECAKIKEGVWGEARSTRAELRLVDYETQLAQVVRARARAFELDRNGSAGGRQSAGAGGAGAQTARRLNHHLRSTDTMNSSSSSPHMASPHDDSMGLRMHPLSSEAQLHSLDSYSHDDIFTLLCSAIPACRSCTRGADGVLVDSLKLRNLLERVVEERSHCIQNHPFYNQS